MTAMERFANSIVVPVVVLDKAEDAVPTARAMLAGGVDTMEITFRTACAPEAIRAVAENCPEVLISGRLRMSVGCSESKRSTVCFSTSAFLPISLTLRSADSPTKRTRRLICGWIPATR